MLDRPISAVALMGEFERARCQRVHRISKPNQHSSGEASSVEHGYNLLLANGIDSIDLQGHYKWSINTVIARRANFFNFGRNPNFEQVILAGTASLIPIVIPLSRGAKKDRVYGGIYPQYVGV